MQRIVTRIKPQGWGFGRYVFVAGVIKESKVFVVIVVNERVVGVAVTLDAGKRSALKHVPGGADAVHHGGRPKLLILCTAFVVGHGVSVKSRGNELSVAGFSVVAGRQQVTG